MVSQGGRPGRWRSGCDAASILGELRYRRLLSILLERSQPVPVRELSVQLAAREADVTPAAVSDAEYEAVLTALEHRYLPKLEQVGWVDRGPAGLTATEPGPTETATVSIPTLQNPEHPHWEPISVVLEHSRRLAVVERIADRKQPLTVTQLAEGLREHEHPSWDSPMPAPQQLRVSLYHTDLPKLSAVDLVEFDATEQTAAPTSLTTAILE